MRWPVVAIVLALLSTAACGSGDAPAAQTSNASEPKACSLLTAAERARLAQGSAVDEVVPMTSGLIKDGCRWIPKDPGDKTIIQLASLASRTWAQTLPAALDAISASGTTLSAADKKSIASIKKGVGDKAGLTNAEACSYFLSLARITGQTEAQQGFTVRYVDLGGAITSATGQTCSHGIFTSVALVRQDLPRTQVMTDLVGEALSLAHERAVAAAK